MRVTFECDNKKLTYGRKFYECLNLYFICGNVIHFNRWLKYIRTLHRYNPILTCLCHYVWQIFKKSFARLILEI